MPLLVAELDWRPSLTLPRFSTNFGASAFVKDLVAGSSGALTFTLLGHPTGFLKVSLPHDAPALPGLDHAKHVLQKEGPAGLFKGIRSPLAGQLVLRSTQVASFGEAKRWIISSRGSSALTPADCYKAGALTGASVALFSGPLDLLRTQTHLQLSRARADPMYRAPFTTLPGCLRAVVRANGLRGPLQGMGASMLRDVPAFALYMGTNEALRLRAARDHYYCRPGDLPTHAALACAGTGALASWGAVHPLSTLKNAVMATDALASTSGGSAVVGGTPWTAPTATAASTARGGAGMVAAARMLWAEGGAARFYRGFGTAVPRAVVANSMLLVAVGKIQSAMGGEGA